MVYDIVKSDLTNEKMSKGLVLLNFHALWCGPCKMLGPVLEEISKELNVDIYKVDIDKDREFAIEMQVQGTPTTFIFKDGEPVNKFVGYAPKDKILEVLKSV
ncbi:thioredoxin family protein [Mycoplasma iguanae]|uniref:Thioredoxin n=1 Tax=Mycoplasma iguanae TaxID=292461 RepID=A0ABY5R8D1_9MOLU|nr:thioredoxin family protein [Mycoplasma iguanae]UVD81566.1 thioredoxin family protein [Mycoplasma iguanae]